MKNAFLFLTLIALLLIGLYPLANFFLQAPTQLSWSQLIATITEREFLNASKHTLIFSMLTTIVSLSFGFVLAFLLTRFKIPGNKIFKFLFRLPYFIPSFLYALAWIQLLNPTSGLLNQLTYSWWGIKPGNIYSLMGLVFVESSVLFTFAYLPLSDAFLKMSQSLEEAALICGANNFRVIKDITLPLLLPQILSSSLLIFASAAASFGVVALIGGPMRYLVLTTQIYQYFQSNSGDFNQGLPLSYFLLLFSLLLMLGQYFILKKKKYYLSTGKGERVKFFSAGPFDYFFSLILTMIFFVIFILPFLAIFFHALLLDPSQGILQSPLGLQKFSFYLFSRPITFLALKNSIFLALITALVSTLLGLMYAYNKKRHHGFLSKLLTPLAQIPYSAPSIVIALAMIMTFSQGILSFYNTLTILFFAYFAKYFFVSASSLEQALGQIHPSLEEASRVHGACFFSMIKDIIYPLLLPSLVSAFFMVFVPILTELTMSTFLYGPKTTTLGVELFKLQSYEDPQGASVLSTLYLMSMLFIGLCFLLVSKYQKKK